ncbi:hypothetical protein [Candidatus Finniella inopinata]|nr:hypothetical protein [Candidatus Finniella inopinata]
MKETDLNKRPLEFILYCAVQLLYNFLVFFRQLVYYRFVMLILSEGINMNSLFPCVVMLIVCCVGSPYGYGGAELSDPLNASELNKPKEIPAMVWFWDLVEKRDKFEELAKPESDNIEEVIRNIYKFTKEICALLGGKYGIDNTRQATKDEREAIYTSIYKTRYFFPAEANIIPNLYLDQGLQNGRENILSDDQLAQKANSAGVDLETYKAHIATIAAADGASFLLIGAKPPSPLTSEHMIQGVLYTHHQVYRQGLGELLAKHVGDEGKNAIIKTLAEINKVSGGSNDMFLNLSREKFRQCIKVYIGKTSTLNDVTYIDAYPPLGVESFDAFLKDISDITGSNNQYVSRKGAELQISRPDATPDHLITALGNVPPNDSDVIKEASLKIMNHPEATPSELMIAGRELRRCNLKELSKAALVKVLKHPEAMASDLVKAGEALLWNKEYDLAIQAGVKIQNHESATTGDFVEALRFFIAGKMDDLVTTLLERIKNQLTAKQLNNVAFNCYAFEQKMRAVELYKMVIDRADATISDLETAAKSLEELLKGTNDAKIIEAWKKVGAKLLNAFDSTVPVLGDVARKLIELNESALAKQMYEKILKMPIRGEQITRQGGIGAGGQLYSYDRISSQPMLDDLYRFQGVAMDLERFREIDLAKKAWEKIKNFSNNNAGYCWEFSTHAEAALKRLEPATSSSSSSSSK